MSKQELPWHFGLNIMKNATGEAERLEAELSMQKSDVWSWLQMKAAALASSEPGEKVALYPWAEALLVEWDQAHEGLERVEVDEDGAPHFTRTASNSMLVDRHMLPSKRLYAVRVAISFREKQIDRYHLVRRMTWKGDDIWMGTRCGTAFSFVQLHAVDRGLRGDELARALGCAGECKRCRKGRDKDDGIEEKPARRVIPAGSLVRVNSAGAIEAAADVDGATFIGIAVADSDPHTNMIQVQIGGERVLEMETFDRRDDETRNEASAPDAAAQSSARDRSPDR